MYIERNNDVITGEKDLEHLKKYANFLGCPDNIKRKQTKEFISYRCEIGNKYLKQVLVDKYNFTTSKSKDLVFVDTNVFSNENLIRHYIRGYFDGDGCIGITPKISKITNKISYYPYLSLLGTKEMLSSILYYLDLNNNLVKTNSSGNFTYNIHLACQKASYVADLMYKDSIIYLERKYNKYLEICRHYKKL